MLEKHSFCFLSCRNTSQCRGIHTPCFGRSHFTAESDVVTVEAKIQCNLEIYRRTSCLKRCTADETWPRSDLIWHVFMIWSQWTAQDTATSIFEDLIITTACFMHITSVWNTHVSRLKLWEFSTWLMLNSTMFKVQRWKRFWSYHAFATYYIKSHT